jgi:hypothetical protein
MAKTWQKTQRMNSSSPVATNYAYVLVFIFRFIFLRSYYQQTNVVGRPEFVVLN